jgi:hypothetical protein
MELQTSNNLKLLLISPAYPKFGRNELVSHDEAEMDSPPLESRPVLTLGHHEKASTLAAFRPWLAGFPLLP